VTAPPHYRPPLKLLKELGITEPGDIWIEAIAEHCDATVIYERLEGAEARIIGFNDRAIITVNSSAPLERRRFSAGHELGHWMRDRGKVSFSCTAKLFVGEWSNDNPERRANRYAVELLLPDFMFAPRAKNKEITFATVRDLAKEFKTSLTATAIRLVELGSFPAMIVCNEPGRRKWFIRGPDVPDVLWPHDEPGRDTVAYDLLRVSESLAGSADIYADGWISHQDSHKYSLQEDSIRLGSSGMVLSLLWWKNERQLLDLQEEDY
jgi:Zn-dependent peptidase ImmA (M78 family)